MTVWATQPLLPGKPRSAKAPAWKPSAGYVPGPEEQGESISLEIPDWGCEAPAPAAPPAPVRPASAARPASSTARLPAKARPGAPSAHPAACTAAEAPAPAEELSLSIELTDWLPPLAADPASRASHTSLPAVVEQGAQCAPGPDPTDGDGHEGGIDLRAAARSVAELAFDLDVLVACAVLEGACGPLPDVPARSCTTVFSPSYLAGLGDIAPLHR